MSIRAYGFATDPGLTTRTKQQESYDLTYRVVTEVSEVITDHEPNTWFGSQKVLTPRLCRWYERIRSFDFDWEYRPGRINVADPLSRCPAFLNVLLAAVLTRAGRANEPALSSPPEASVVARPNREVRSMLQGSQGMMPGQATEPAPVAGDSSLAGEDARSARELEPVVWPLKGTGAQVQL